MTFDLRALEIFADVAGRGSMTATARAMGLTQSAVSQAVQRLEESLDAPLVDRTRRPLGLTPAGEVALRRASSVLNASDALASDVRGAQSDQPMRLRIGLVDSVAGTIGPAIVRALRREAAQVALYSGISPDLTDGILSRDVSVYVGVDTLKGRAGFRRSLVLREPHIVVAPKSVARGMRRARLGDLAATLPFVRYSLRSRIGADIETYIEGRALALANTLEFDETDTVLSMVAAGLGFAVTTPLCLYHGRAHLPGLAVLPLETRFDRRLYLFSQAPVDRALDARITDEVRTAFERVFAERVAQIAPWAAEQASYG
jgi:DNA-binding transcriptional LysR family regulator